MVVEANEAEKECVEMRYKFEFEIEDLTQEEADSLLDTIVTWAETQGAYMTGGAGLCTPRSTEAEAAAFTAWLAAWDAYKEGNSG